MISKSSPKSIKRRATWVMNIVKIIIPVLIIVILGYIAMMNFQSRQRLEYSEHLQDVAVTIDGEDLTLADLMFYVLYEEQRVEEQARIYNPESPKDYWNTHGNGYFLQGQVKEAVMGMAVHDRILYRMSQQENQAMTSDQKDMLENARTDFWTGLYDEQIEKMPVDFEDVNLVIGQICQAQIYQQQLAEEMETTYSGLNWNGYDYEQLLQEHDVKINDRVWDRVILGDITLTHTRVNYINGWDSEDERMRNEQ